MTVRFNRSTYTLRDLNTSEVFPNRPISSLTSTQIGINPNFTVASHLWDVQVINPGAVPSNRFQFNVVSPDLVIEDVTFNPGNVVSGRTLSIGFRVKNIGPGNAPPTQARLRLSSDNTLTASDLALSPLDMNIPAIAYGSSYDFSGSITVPSTTPQGNYYIGVFADWNNQGNQSDVTNDAGLSSTPVTVLGTGISPPTIIVQPQSQTVTAGNSVVFSVIADGAAPFSYEWRRDGKIISGSTGASLNLTNVTTNQAGIYLVKVSNPGGLLTSEPALLTVESGTPLPSTQPGPVEIACTAGALLTGGFTVCEGNIDPGKPSIVITHGWQVTGTYNGEPPPWVQGMVDEIKKRLNKEGSLAVNILTYNWKEAYSPVFSFPAGFIDGHGNNLAAKLSDLLGPSYSQEIHFIGHSYGSLVNAKAVNRLHEMRPEIQITQFTILDAPIRALANLGGYLTWFGQAIFHALLPSHPAVGWVDNYYGSNLFIDPAFGWPVLNAAPSDGLQVPGSHEDVHERYRETICKGADCENTVTTFGFNYSAILSNFTNRPAPQKWTANPIYAAAGTLLDKTPDVLGEVLYKVEGVVNQVTETVSGQLRNLMQYIKSSPSATATNLTIPANAELVAFDFRFSKPGGGDWLTVSFNDTLLFSFLGSDFVAGGYQHVLIPVGHIAGETGVLTARLNDSGTEPAEVLVSNFQFLSSAVADLLVTNTNNQTTTVPGDPIVYTIVVTNNGPATVTGATVTDNFPAILSAVSWTCVASAGSSCTATGSGNINDVINLLVGGTATYTAIGTIDPAATGTLINTASVAPLVGVTDPNPDNNSATDTDALVPQADLSVASAGTSGTIIPGATVLYDLNPSNGGPSNATSVSVVDTLPVGVGFVNASGSGWDCGFNNVLRTITCSRASIAVGAAPPITVTINVPALGGQLTDSVAVSSATSDANTSNNTYNFILLVQPTVSINDVSIVEGNSGATNALFTATLSAASTQTVTVNYSTTNGTGSAGSDYVAQSGTLTFDPGETLKNIIIQVTGDTALEPNETFFVNLSGASNAVIAISQGTGTIVNDDVSLAVIAFHATPSGFDVDFNKPVDVSVLNLYDTEAQLFGPADVTVVGAATGPVRGSLVLDATGRTATFVRTGGVLVPDIYTVTLRSAANGFEDTDGNLLDGDADGTPGGDFVTSFSVAPSSAVIVSAPDFAVGPGQAVNVPFNRTGLPIVLTGGANVTNVEFTLLYDPSSLVITAVSPGDALPPDATVQTQSAAPGSLVLQFGAPNGFGTSPIELARLRATVSQTATYKSAQVLSFEVTNISPAGSGVITADAVHVVAYIGDTTGNAAYSALDAQRVLRIAAGLDSGFAAYPLIDPVLIGDTTWNGSISSLDATRILQEVVGIDRPEIPPLPQQ